MILVGGVLGLGCKRGLLLMGGLGEGTSDKIQNNFTGCLLSLSSKQIRLLDKSYTFFFHGHYQDMTGSMKT